MIKRFHSFVISLLLVLIVGQLCHAAALGGGARAIGMGGAYTAVADDGAAAYWNPAGITQVKFGLMPTVGVQGKFGEIAKVMQGDLVDNFEGSLSLNAGVGLTFRHFAFNMFSDLNGHVDGHVAQSGNYQHQTMDAINQVALSLAKEFTGLFAVGVNAKYVSYENLTKKLGLDGNSYGSDENKGAGFAVDLGAMAKVGKLVRVGAVLKDYPLAKVKLDDGQVYELPTRVAVGGAVKVPLLGTLVAVDLEKPFKGEEKDFRYRLGVEQPILGLIFLRAGGYQAEEKFNLTAGFGLKLGPAVLDTAAALDKENPVYQATLGLKF
ncbi:MAG: hypothetical protein GX050_04770 [Firmicutes bacterium]|nr:hypothetical protein [Bacillota bacterium]